MIERDVWPPGRLVRPRGGARGGAVAEPERPESATDTDAARPVTASEAATRPPPATHTGPPTTEPRGARPPADEPDGGGSAPASKPPATVEPKAVEPKAIEANAAKAVKAIEAGALARVAREPGRQLLEPPVERPPGFPTVELLASKDAEANELRASLAELRELLDNAGDMATAPAEAGATPNRAPQSRLGPPPESRRPVRDRGRRRATVVIVAVPATLLAATVATVIGLRSSGETPQAPPPRPPVASPSATASTSASAALPVIPAPQPAPAGSLPTSGPGVTAPGSILLVRTLPTGSLDIVEQAVLPAGVRTLRLGLASAAGLTGEAAETTPIVRELRASLDGTPVAVTAEPAAGDTPAGWQIGDESGPLATRVLLHYRVSDAVVLDAPSADGRALGVVAPLVGGQLHAAGLPLLVRGMGRKVIGISCPGAPLADSLCGAVVPGAWTATVPASSRTAIVLLQLQLNAG